jgi:hypothetical protein
MHTLHWVPFGKVSPGRSGWKAFQFVRRRGTSFCSAGTLNPAIDAQTTSTYALLSDSNSRRLGTPQAARRRDSWRYGNRPVPSSF